MSDETTTPVPLSAIGSDFMERYNAFEARAAELHPANKLCLFAALRKAHIATVTVRFDGYGDSGQIEDVTAIVGDQTEWAIPDAIVDLQRLDFGQEQPVTLSQPLSEAIETMSYALLASSHRGWENNGGAYGEFDFDVAAGTITLDYNERFETSENYRHDF